MAGTFIALYHFVRGYPIVAVYNRDGAKGTEGKEPQLIENVRKGGILVKPERKIVAPLDETGEGSCIGINENGLVVLANDISSVSDEGYTLRGQLVLEALTNKNAEMALLHALCDVYSRRYNNFNLFCADRTNASVLYYDNGFVRVNRVDKGVHVLTYDKINNTKDPKIANALMLLNNSKIESGSLPIEEIIKELMEICRYYNEFEHSKSICVYDNPGTLSSTIIAVDEQLKKNIMWYSHGNPCEKKYKDYSSLVR